jgi:hypothetical protein
MDTISTNLLLHTQLRMEPMVGIEPTTDGLRNRCSTTELHWPAKLKKALSQVTPEHQNFKRIAPTDNHTI